MKPWDLAILLAAVCSPTACLQDDHGTEAADEPGVEAPVFEPSPGSWVTGADERYVHATIALDAPFPVDDWCVGVSLVAKGALRANGTFCRDDSESGPDELLADLRCVGGSHYTMLVVVHHLAPSEEEIPWSSECGALGCTYEVECSERVNALEVRLPIARR